MVSRHVWLATVLSLAICSAREAGAQVAKQGSAYLLHARYHANEAHVYKVLAAVGGLTANDKAIGVNFAVRFRVLAIASRYATIRLTVERPQSFGQSLPIDTKSSTIRLDRFNRPVGTAQSGQVFASYPDHPVRMGEPWSADSTLVLGPKKGALVRVTYKLVRIDSSRGRKIAVLQLAFNGVTPGEGTSLVDCADGALLSSVLNLRMSDPDGHVFPVQLSLRRES